jgi:hypothetical protein
VGAFAVPALAASSGNFLVGSCLHSQREPSTVILTCADGAMSIEHIKWSSFGKATATGTGSAHIKSCTPDCAAGKFHDYPVQVKASKPKMCPDKRSDYRQMTLTYTGSRPPGVSESKPTKAYVVSCPIS